MFAEYGVRKRWRKSARNDSAIAINNGNQCRAERERRRVDAVEDRRLLATFYPSASADDGDPDSLRAAIIAANANGEDNTIVLGAGTYKLTIADTNGQEGTAAEGDLDLTSAGHAITIQGRSAGATIIDGGGIDRVFQVMDGVNATISGLTIQNGDTQEPLLFGFTEYHLERRMKSVPMLVRTAR